jgi:hypothetical protein
MSAQDVYVASGVQPDPVRVWYEVPEQAVDLLRQTTDPDETFAECLLRLLLEREGTYRQVVRENQRLRSAIAAHQEAIESIGTVNVADDQSRARAEAKRAADLILWQFHERAPRHG